MGEIGEKINNSIEPEATTLERLEQYVINTPEKTAFIYQPEERITFRELWEISGKIYAWLKAKGIGAEDVILYSLPRGILLYACMVGTMRAGAAFVLTETENDPKRTAYIKKNSGCSLYVDEECMKEILKGQPLEGYEPVNRHNLCYIAYTSGTTGHPKGVMHEYGSLDNAWKAAMVDGKAIMYDTDTFLVMSPMNFVAVPICYAYSCAHGCALAMMPYEYAKSNDSFSEYLEKAGVTCGYVTPSFLRKHLPFRYPWHMCILSSEPADGLYTPGMNCYNTYASTESGCLLSVYELKKPMTPAPVGKSYSDVEVFVADDEGKEVMPGILGEVCFKTPYVRGYLDASAGSGKRTEDGIFHTGDAGKKDAEGILTVRGRIDEMFKIGGYRIEPDEVANAVKSVSGLSHVIVRGFVFKDISSVNVFYTGDIFVDPVEMREKLHTVLPEYMIPTNYYRLNDFPYLSTGKVDKLKLLPPEGSWECFEELTGSGLRLIGVGRTAQVYDMGESMVLKLFKPSIPFASIQSEMSRTHAAFRSGIPAPDSFGIVRSDDRYGFLMEKKHGVRLEQKIKEQPEERLRLIAKFTEAMKAMHHIRITEPGLPDVRKEAIYFSEKLNKEYCSGEEAELIRSVFENIPATENFVHCDGHTGNAGIVGTEIYFYDMMFSGIGHPVYDFLAMYSHYVFLPSFCTEEEFKKKNNMSKADAEAMFDSFLESYYPGADAEKLSEIKTIVRGVHAAQISLASVRMPGVFTEQMLKEVKERAVAFAKHYPIEKMENEIREWSRLE